MCLLLLPRSIQNLSGNAKWNLEVFWSSCMSKHSLFLLWADEEFQMHGSIMFFQRRSSKVMKAEERTWILCKLLNITRQNRGHGTVYLTFHCSLSPYPGDTYLNIFTYVICGGGLTSQRAKPHTAACSLHHQRDRGKRGWFKAGKLTDWDNGSLIGGKKVHVHMYISKVKLCFP